ncbi:hypothetical protein KC19_5G022600 [Ceratodon purpureus]|uniref:Uncharacterized protein n=1 Tax=Ceratodon purpureus TaxID=3225 RepID=A0A8T0HY24_CERPU|nr:hypothetical protein KC19_5G022600 [Ceratodon purpureus]
MCREMGGVGRKLKSTVVELMVARAESVALEGRLKQWTPEGRVGESGGGCEFCGGIGRPAPWWRRYAPVGGAMRCLICFSSPFATGLWGIWTNHGAESWQRSRKGILSPTL